MTAHTLHHKVRLTILRAEHIGMCFGVRDAITLAKREVRSRPLTVLGELVHNATVLEELRDRGVRFEDQPEAVETETVMITAHGASNRARTRAHRGGLTLKDATCPLVHYAHKQVCDLVAAGYHPVIIGRHGHVEVRGLTEDFPESDVVLSREEIDALDSRPRFGVVAQTTQPVARVRALVEHIRARFPEAEVRFVDTVCQPTKQRQNAAETLAKQSDIILVVGGANSNNTHELARTCRRFCGRVHHVQGPDDIRPEWLPKAGTLGITAGTSTPDHLINAVEAKVRELA
ncbi:MAG: 4-hydroxy-3-methylbut-2-enyl diphosphate reductase [Verrucomicrobia bacterium]|nr:4-hydroxy-3-methylbut-2-enyl diphosphate reductase [Verrucomicrobiota bacterium]